MLIVFLLLILAGILLVVLYIWYIKIIFRKSKVLEALSGIDIQLEKRFSLIPNILIIAKKFMIHERGLLAEITQLRAQSQSNNYNKNDAKEISKHLKMIEEVNNKLGQLMISVEDYPELKSDLLMIQAQKTYNEIEQQIAASRRFYNSSVNLLNNAVQIFPGNMLAKIANITCMPFYKTEASFKQPVNSGDLL